MNEVKYCEDCKHSHRYVVGGSLLVCGNPDVSGAAMFVARKPQTIHMQPCSTARCSLGKCGADAVLFDPKVDKGIKASQGRKWWKIWG